MLKKLLKSQRGQGMTEYLVVVALMALASVAVVGYYGDVVQYTFARMSYVLSGEDSTSKSLQTTQKGKADSARDYASQTTTFKDF